MVEVSLCEWIEVEENVRPRLRFVYNDDKLRSNV